VTGFNISSIGVLLHTSVAIAGSEPPLQQQQQQLSRLTGANAVGTVAPADDSDALSGCN